ncbi:lytic transglycosylase [Salmonella enterica subsp. enterica serovar Enteritidis]|nr:lytic transglycosylase [Salmonella enterica subsp. enterica serovar Enteritidis]
MSIKIPVSAQFDAADIQKKIQIINDQIKILGNTVAMAQNKKFEPVTLKSKEDLEAFTKQVQKLLKYQTELAQKMGGAGMGGKNPFLQDWTKIYGDKATRIEKMRAALQFMGAEFNDHPGPKPKPPAPPVPPVPPSPHPGGFNWGGWGKQGLNVLNSGLNAAGPVGGVFSNALNSGLSGGAGAGLMGLVGGLAAMGVGKIIGAIADKIDKAQDAAIGMDKIYRQIGGIASYGKVKNTVYSAADRLGMDVTEAIGLGSAYSRAANLRRGDNLGTGMLISGGMARSYGLEPGSVAGIMGGFRGSNIARNDMDSRKIGLVIGETIAKSGAFAKADEMMQAVSQYAIAQARQSLNAPSIGAYGGAMSSLMGMNLPGLDVAGSAGLLQRANAALMGGGAMGEASQFLTARVGNRMGLNPFQLRMMRENGMFATKSSTFGAGSIYGSTMGAGPGGDQSFFSATRDQLRTNYGGNKEMYYMALANHMGISISQAMALDKMDSGVVNGAGSRMSRLGLDIGKVNATSYATLGQIESGKGLGELSQSYLRMGGKNALSKDERNNLLAAYGGNDPEKLKDVLMGIASKRGAVETEGSQIRDGIAQMNNTMTRLADNAIPALNIMRMAMMKMVGGTESGLKEQYIRNETQERRKAIFTKYATEREQLATARRNLISAGISANDPKGYAAWSRLHQQEAAYQQRINGELAQVDKDVKLETSGVSATEVSGATGGGSLGASAAVNAAEGGGALPAGAGASGNVAGGNVGNMRAVGGGWQRFGSAREGLAGMASQLLRYQSGRFNRNSRKRTLRQIINTYAPPNENKTSEYVQQVSAWTGLSPDAEIDLRDHDTMAKVLRAMVRKENGNKGLAAAEGHYDEAIGDAMRKQSNFTADYPSEVNLNMKLETPQGNYSAQHTLKPKTFQAPNTPALRMQ